VRVALARFRALLELDPSGFGRAIDRAPNQALRQAIMELIGLGADAAAMLRLLQAAPAVVDEAGTWNGSVFALMLLDSLAWHVQREMVSRRPAQLGIGFPAPRDKAEAKAVYREFFQTAAKRADGRFLAMAFALESVRRATHPRTMPGVDWTAEEIALEEAIDALAGVGITIQDLRTDWQRRSDKLASAGSAIRETAVPHLLTAACLWGTHCYSSDPVPGVRQGAVPGVGAAVVWAWYRDALHDADAELAGHLNPYGPAARWIFTILGLAVAVLNDPVAETQTQWAALYEQRLRGRMVAESDASAPSLHLLRVARAALEWFVGGASVGAASAERAESMWRLLHDVALQLPGSLYGDHFRQARHALTALYAYLPHVFRDRWRVVLGEDAAMLAADDIVCAIAAANLAGNGIVTRDVLEAMRGAGCDPMRAGEILKTYSDRVEQKDASVVEALRLLEVFRSPPP
jgi:hypothetical protein